MERLLIVSASQKTADSLRALLVPGFCPAADTVPSAARARRDAAQRDYPLALVNAPLPDDSGTGLARDLARSGTDVVMLAGQELALGDPGSYPAPAFILEKPVNRALLENTLRALRFARARGELLREENRKLAAKLEESRLVGRAKCALIAYRQMTEEEAHHYIEQVAMDSRLPKKEVARDILRTFEG